MPYNPANAPQDFGESLSKTMEGLKQMDKPNLGNLLKACGPLLSYCFLSQLDLPEPVAEAREALRVNVDQQRLDTLRAQMNSKAPFLMAEKPPAEETEEKELPKTPEELAIEEELKSKGFVWDAVTGNYLNPRLFNVDAMRSDPLLPYEFHDRSGGLVTCYFRESFGDRLKKADEKMQNNGKRLIINSSFRSNRKQLAINHDHTVKTKAQVGQSQHEAGMAADISNWQEAQDYLKDEGVYGGDYKNLVNDKWHFDTRMG